MSLLKSLYMPMPTFNQYYKQTTHFKDPHSFGQRPLRENIPLILSVYRSINRIKFQILINFIGPAGGRKTVDHYFFMYFVTIFDHFHL